VSPLVRHAEEILDTAAIGAQNVAIVIGRSGDIRILDPAGWSLPALRTEYGAAAVYSVEHRGDTIRVDGWDGERSCRLEKSMCRRQTAAFLPRPPSNYMMRSAIGA
jgi:hypothetical protein